MHIGFVSTRLAGTDGVSLETRKWAQIYRRLGHDCFFCAGDLDPDLPGQVTPEMHFNHPSALAIQARAFGASEPDPALLQEIEALAAPLRQALARFVEAHAIDVLIVQNALAIPMHLPLGAALTDFIADHNFPTIAHNHDLYWERERFRVNRVQEILERCFPPALPSVRHVVINSLAQANLRARKGLESVIVPNIFDYERAAPGLTGANRDLRASLGLTDEHLLILQPTRVIPRKGIELAIELVARLQQPQHRERLQGKQPVLVISHQAGDEGMDYLARLQAEAAARGVDLRYAGPRFAARPPQQPVETPPEERVYALWDAYVHADFVTYPSLVEGFGNALLETIYFQLPALVNRYDVYKADIGPLGFDLVEIDGAITDEIVEQVLRAMMDPVRRRRMVEQNYQIAREHYTLEAVEPILAGLLP
ncbi:MAG: glycosyl transferase family 1 [Caldilineae bacterium]|nr:MAG: glycosyl transferase family 1 [Caldilineae bacterium]